MTPKQERFVAEFLIDLNATQAAIRAGYAKSGARVEGARLLGNAKVSAAVQKAMARRQERTEITQDYVIREITQVIEDRRGTGEHSNPNAVLKGAELLGRHLAMFTDKLDTRLTLEHLSDEELDEQIAEYEHGSPGASRTTH